MGFTKAGADDTRRAAASSAVALRGRMEGAARQRRSLLSPESVAVV